MSHGRHHPHPGEIIAVDRNYVPMQEISRRKALCSVDAALLKAQAAALSDVLSGGVRVAFGSKDAVEAAKDLFDRVETL